jgi:hypothetical protein
MRWASDSAQRARNGRIASTSTWSRPAGASAGVPGRTSPVEVSTRAVASYHVVTNGSSALPSRPIATIVS